MTESDRLKDYLDLAEVLLVSLDASGSIRLLNTFGCQLLGVTSEKAVGKNWFEAFTPEEGRAERLARFTGMMDGTRDLSHSFTSEVITSSGEHRVLGMRAALVRDADGNVVEVLGSGGDITERLKSQRALLFRSLLLDSAGDGIAAGDMDGRLVYANEALADMHGYDVDEMTRLEPWSWVSPSAADRIRRSLEHPDGENDGEPIEVEAVRADGSRFPVEVRSRAVHWDDGSFVILVVRDITERRRAQSALQQAGLRDPLTGLGNRESLRERLGLATAHAHRTGEKVGVLLTNIDRFDTVNLSFGPAVGDKVLQRIAERLANAARDAALLSRTGSDEFGMVLSEIDGEADAVAQAEALRALLREPIIVDGHEVHLTATVGVVVEEPGEASVESLLTKAATALCQGKRAGRDTYVIYRETAPEEQRERFKLRTALRYALDRGELAVHFQPQVTTSDGRLTGAEALLRWTHPELGPVPADVVVALAEETGLIVDIGAWVLRTACEECATWHAAGHEAMVVAVNLSGRQFRTGDIVETVGRVLRRTGLPPSALELEVTERVVMRDLDAVSAAFDRFREMGVRVAIDDFGTGHSSLERLKRFPVETLKIDRSFIADLCTDEDSAAITRSIIALGHALRLEVVAEGVERGDQLAVLKAAGCDKIQGWLFSKALPADEFALLLLSQRPRVA